MDQNAGLSTNAHIASLITILLTAAPDVDIKETEGRTTEISAEAMTRSLQKGLQGGKTKSKLVMNNLINYCSVLFSIHS